MGSQEVQVSSSDTRCSRSSGGSGSSEGSREGHWDRLGLFPMLFRGPVIFFLFFSYFFSLMFQILGDMKTFFSILSKLSNNNGS